MDKKKEPSSRFAARRTLFHVWYHARSGAISVGQVRSATVRDFCPALIKPDRAWYHTWNSVLLAPNLENGSFFLSRLVRRTCFFIGWERGRVRWFFWGRNEKRLMGTKVCFTCSLGSLYTSPTNESSLGWCFRLSSWRPNISSSFSRAVSIVT